MGDGEALKIAIDLLHVPARVPKVRAEPLPQGVPLLLRIAADDREALRMAVRILDRTPGTVRDAATFFIEQALLCPEADSYRVLGATSATSSRELRRNMALLIRWLHPDSNPSGRRSVFVNRITRAWDDLKTPERRAAYDQEMWARDQKKSAGRHLGRQRRRPSIPALPLNKDPSGDGLFRRALAFLRGGKR